MARAERQRDRILEQLATIDPADHVRYGEVGRDLARCEEALTDAENRWLELVDEADR